MAEPFGEQGPERKVASEAASASGAEDAKVVHEHTSVEASGHRVGFLARLLQVLRRSASSDRQQRAARLGRYIGYHFRDPELLDQALTHRSFLTGTRKDRLVSNERLELLGDAVLGLAVTEFLFRRFPKKPEGELTNMKSLIVSRKVLSRVARRIRLGEFILMSRAEERSGGRQRPSILADSLEALIGAIYMDGGFEEAMRFIRRFVLAGMDQYLSEEVYHNYKSELLEYAQARGWGNPVYRVVKEEGPDHDKTFTVEVDVAGHARGVGKGRTKKQAEQQAAKEAMKQLTEHEG